MLYNQPYNAVYNSTVPRINTRVIGIKVFDLSEQSSLIINVRAFLFLYPFLFKIHVKLFKNIATNILKTKSLHQLDKIICITCLQISKITSGF
jgi:hypothetical protein